MRNFNFPLRRSAALVVLGASALLTGCVVAPVEPAYTYSYSTYGAPPPARYEVVPVAPNAAYVWTPGVWIWGGSRYDWRPGYWGPPRPGFRAGPPRYPHGPHHGWRGGPRGHR